jgi:hypothetical protein
MMMKMKMNLQSRRKAPPTAQMLFWPDKAIRRRVAETERKTFQLSQRTWDLLAVWKKETGQTLIHIQIVVFVEKRFWFSMILTHRSKSLVGIQKEKLSHCGLYQQLWDTPYHSQVRLYY